MFQIKQKPGRFRLDLYKHFGSPCKECDLVAEYAFCPSFFDFEETYLWNNFAQLFCFTDTHVNCREAGEW